MSLNKGVNMQEIPEATGTYKSRKFVLTTIGLVLITVVTIMGTFFPTLPSIMPTFTGGILGVLSLYFTGNVVNKWVVGKTLTQQENDEGEPDA